MLFLRSFWKEILVVLLVVGLGFSIYHIGVSHEKLHSQDEIEAVHKKYNEELSLKIEEVRKLGDSLVANNKANTIVFEKNVDKKLQEILNNSKQVPLITLNPTTNQCTLSPSFLESYNSLLRVP